MRQLIKQRKIDGLYHFTQAENLKYIFKYGLVPKDTLMRIAEENKFEIKQTDAQRLDGRTNTVSTSIAFPNDIMFDVKSNYYLRGHDWAVLRLDTDIMCDFKCAYLSTNAASGKVSNKSEAELIGKKAFEELFADCVEASKELKYRTTSGSIIRDADPTDSQAEVMVYETIPIHYILNVYFENAETMQKYLDDIPADIPVDVRVEVFGRRHKYES